MMSDTPRTDNVVLVSHESVYGTWAELRDLARELERELTTAKTNWAAIRATLDVCSSDEERKLRAENAALRDELTNCAETLQAVREDRAKHIADNARLANALMSRDIGINELRQRVAELERDAGRYRWIRRCRHGDPYDDDHNAETPYEMAWSSIDGLVTVTDDEYDALVDAAIAQEIAWKEPKP